MLLPVPFVALARRLRAFSRQPGDVLQGTQQRLGLTKLRCDLANGRQNHGLAVADRAVCDADSDGVSDQWSHVEMEWWRRLVINALVNEVPVGVEVVGDTTEPLGQAEALELAELHEARTAGNGPFGWFGFVEQTVEQILPALVEGKVALNLIEHRETRRKTGGDRKLVEQSPGEGVQRADRRVIEPIEGGLVSGPEAWVVPGRCGVFENLADAMTKFGGGFLGECDGCDRIDGDTRGDQRDNPTNKTGRLASAGPGLDEQRRVEVGGDPGARWLIDGKQPVTHRRPCRRRCRQTIESASGRVAFVPSPKIVRRCRANQAGSSDTSRRSETPVVLAHSGSTQPRFHRPQTQRHLGRAPTPAG